MFAREVMLSSPVPDKGSELPARLLLAQTQSSAPTVVPATMPVLVILAVQRDIPAVPAHFVS